MKEIDGRCNILGLVAALVALLAGCRPAAVGEVVDARPYQLVIGDDFIPTAYAPLDEALEPAGGGTLPALFISADGSTGVATAHMAGRANPDPRKTWVVVRDMAGGQERGRFHPPVSGLVGGLSADGSRLLWQPFPPLSTYPPPVDWYVLDAAGGAVVGHIVDEDNACFRQYAMLSPDGQRVYCLVDPALSEIGFSQPVRVVAYEVGGRGHPAATTGRPAAEIALVTRIGQRPTSDGAGWELLEPALALSPDGRTLAVVHADADAVTLIDAATLTMLETQFLARNSVSWLGVRAAEAKGIMRGTIRHAAFSDDGRFLYIYSQILPEAGDEPPDVRGLAVVDLERERVAAEALADYQIQWLLPAPDGMVFAFGTTEVNLGPYEIRASSPSMLWRLDGRTLAVLAERAFVGYRSGRLVLRR